jgi:hypothetical protein
MGQKRKRQNLLMAGTNVSKICLNGIRLLLQVDKINDALNILYFMAIWAGIKMRGATKKYTKEEHWFDKECSERKGKIREGLIKLRRMIMKKRRIKYWKRIKKCDKTMENKREVKQRKQSKLRN